VTFVLVFYDFGSGFFFEVMVRTEIVPQNVPSGMFKVSEYSNKNGKEI